MFELSKTEEVLQLISVTKSNSGISGPQLARAHIRLGELIGQKIPFAPKETTVVAMLRGGIFFAQGIYFQLGCKYELYDPKNGNFVKPKTKHVIIADSVINTGQTIKEILTPDMIVASCVINEDAVPLFENVQHLEIQN